MSTVVLQSAGAFIGSLFGPVGSAIGSALGAMAGYAIDSRLLASTQRIEGPRLAGMRPFSAEEGTPLARVYGTVRISGDIIWATRFEEARRSERQGGKGGGPKVTTYSYFANVALALCEGEIGCVRRIWADGRELDLDDVTLRVHRGTEDQPADPLIEARQGAGNAPAYRGTAYVVFERFPLGDYGNRIPQFQFEVVRPVGRLNRQIRSVALLPGSTEYGLSPRAVTRQMRPGVTETLNRNVLHGRSDLVASLDELQALCPNLEEVAVIVSWFGDDLRAGQCRLRPAVVDANPSGLSEPWQVSGLTRQSAPVASKIGGASTSGGTPTDRSVVECIAEIRARGLKVALYPFIMMDIVPGNGLPDPYGGDGQPAFPWRGRITSTPAPGRPGSADKTQAARVQIAAFCGAALPGQFPVAGGQVGFSGSPTDWGYRRFILHYAHLAALAGGVDAFLIGSELRGLTTLRDGAGAFPFVEALGTLAGEVRAILGAGTDITYGADWSEYFGYQPGDGSGDVLFHLDPLWAHPAISSVGIDNYMPLCDWRDGDYGGGNPDGFRGPCDRDALRGQIVAGEGFDWYYADAAARSSRLRTPITDGGYAKPWVFRYKDLRGWWENRHFDRIGGVEKPQPTPWQPRSKSIRFTELGCPAVDKGANQPNVFPDAKSSENATPYFSSGGRSDAMQARFLEAHFDHWDPQSPHFDAAANPVSPVYGGRMVDPAHICVWAWDARPFPAFPAMTGTWRDGDNWHRGHWLNGRLSSVTTGGLFAGILADHGLEGIDATQAGGSIAGYVVDRPLTARAALEPLVELFGVAVRDDGGVVTLDDELAPGMPALALDALAMAQNGTVIERVRAPERDVPRETELSFADPFRDYQAALVRFAQPGGAGGAVEAVSFPGFLEAGAAEALLADWGHRRRAARETVGFSLPAARIDVTPGALVSLPGEDGAGYLVTEVELGAMRSVSARRLVRAVPAPWRSGRMAPARSQAGVVGAPHALFIDLPMLPGAEQPAGQFRVAAFARPWRSQLVYSSAQEEGFVHTATVTQPATLGEVVAAGPGRFAGRWDRIGSIVVALHDGALASAAPAALLNGANTAAIRADSGTWEVFQFGQAEEIAPSVWQLTLLLRGQSGTLDAAMAGVSAGAPFVLLDGAVVAAGLAHEFAGLPLNWRIGPSGKDFGPPYFVGMTATGGMRSQLPLSPVHLHLAPRGGDLDLSWIRRGRLDADSWLGEDIPLAEQAERYRIIVATAGGAVRRTVDVDTPRWTYMAAWLAADFPSRPATVAVGVSQVSLAAGEGPPARRSFTLA
jgi:hypothetical protein